MLNNYYFKEDEKSADSMNEFDKESIAYLNSQYNYTAEAVVKDSGLSPEDLKKLYEANPEPKKFIDSIMEEIWFLTGNKFNVILSGGRNL